MVTKQGGVDSKGGERVVRQLMPPWSSVAAAGTVVFMLLSCYHWMGMRWLAQPFVDLARLGRALFGG